MSNYLAGLRVGGTLEMRGPTGLERYGSKGPGTFTRSEREWSGITHIAMISGGTGVTPMLQIINHVLQDKLDPTHVSLLSFTTAVSDFLLKDELEELKEGSNGRFMFQFVCSRAAPGGPHKNIFLGSMRNLKADMLVELLGVPTGDTTMVCICGPDGFTDHAKTLCKQHFTNVLIW